MLDFMSNIFNSFADSLKEVLPTSPFAQFIDDFAGMPYLSWVNWFIPVGEIITVVQVWLFAIATFYIYSIVLRWVKAIGD